MVGFRERDFGATFGNIMSFGPMGLPYSLGQFEAVVNYQRWIKLNCHGVTQMFGANAIRLRATYYRGATDKSALADKELQVVADDGTMQLPDGWLECFWIDASGACLFAHGAPMIRIFSGAGPLEKMPRCRPQNIHDQPKYSKIRRSIPPHLSHPTVYRGGNPCHDPPRLTLLPEDLPQIQNPDQRELAAQILRRMQTGTPATGSSTPRPTSSGNNCRAAAAPALCSLFDRPLLHFSPAVYNGPRFSAISR